MNRLVRISPGVLFLLCMSAGLALFFMAASPANASLINIFGPSPTPTQENLWGYANVPKPASTPTPILVLPSDTPAPAVAEVPALEMEIVEQDAASTAPGSSAAPDLSYTGSKYILVDISEQHMYVYEGGALVYSFVASTGIGNSTRIGNFQVQSKIPNAYGSTWNIWMPHWLGIYWSHGLENGIHALPILSNGAVLWAGFLGRPVSYGCVVLGTYDAQVLYDWAELGTPVEIQW